ncbi:MAG: hypothetical protein M3Q36_03905 [bacterium]|nr:hypothetical protein [bacterium]
MLSSTLYVAILLLGICTYTSAVIQMRQGVYSPSFFSRAIWLLLGVNSLAGVMLGGGSSSAKLLAGTLFFGNAAVFISSIKRGSRVFGTIEIVSLVLFFISCAVWVLFREPIVNLIISLVAHFIGGVPTIVRTINKPSSEKAVHWYFFFVASVLTVINSPEKNFHSIIFPVYFILFDGLIIFLVNRKRFFNRY